ncbi:hypothetical protein LZG71_01940 [Dyadobacter sp. CY312]|nr:hypothetical protein [Dyadobacter sp. CY312]
MPVEATPFLRRIGFTSETLIQMYVPELGLSDFNQGTVAGIAFYKSRTYVAFHCVFQVLMKGFRIFNYWNTKSGLTQTRTGGRFGIGYHFV